jgi:hypothetical protein
VLTTPSGELPAVERPRAVNAAARATAQSGSRIGRRCLVRSMGGVSGTVIMMNLEKQVAMSEDRRDSEARTKDARL